ncbi:hypothetical protein LEMLEM_LOCUS9064 [Lemmus lemmus]
MEWKNDFLSAKIDNNGNSEYSSYEYCIKILNSGIKQSDTD